MLCTSLTRKYRVATSGLSRWLFISIVAVLFLFSPTFLRSAHAATHNSPFIIDGSVEEWTVGAGLVYWANNCLGDEFNPIAELRRAPAATGLKTVIQTINTEEEPNPPGETCLTYKYLLSTGDGLYYIENIIGEGDQVRIMRMPLAPPFNPETVKVLAGNEAPNAGRALVEDGDYLYWAVNFTNKILRTHKDGTGPVETVVETNPGPQDFIIVGQTIYWIDKVGVWGKSINCESLPCEGRTQYHEFVGDGFAWGLTYKANPGGGIFGGGFRLIWVQRTGTVGNFTYAIVYRNCPANIICFATFAPDPPNPTPAPPPASPFYTASANRVIGDLVLVDDNIFWTENGGGAGDGVFRKAYNASVDTPPDNIATDQTGIRQELFVHNTNLLYARNANGAPSSDGIYTLPLNAAAITRDFVMEAFEVTQGIQNLANEAPLVGNKTTYVRAYGRQIAGPSTANVEAHLIGTRNDVPLPGSPLKPVNGVRALNTGGNYDRARLNDGWYFLLPESWTTPGNIKLQVVIDPRHLHTDPNLNNNVFPTSGPRQFIFQNQPPVCVMTVPVRTHNPLPSVYDPNVGLMVSNFNRRWPVPETWIFRDSEPVEELEVCTWYGVPYPCYGPYELTDGWGLTNGIPDRDKVIVSLWTRAQLTFNPDACDDIGAPVHFMGMVHPDADAGNADGYASTVSKQSWVRLPAHGPTSSAWNAMDAGDTMAQELAHNHGRKHVNCGGPDNIDSNYPYPPCQIANNGADSYYGFDIASLQPIRPNGAADFMSYGNPRWVSDYTWKALLNKFAAASAANVATVGPLDADQSEQFFVTGMVDGENPRGEITIILNLPASSLPPATRQMAMVQAATAQAAGVQHGDEPHIDYKLRLLDTEGNVVQERPLVLQPLDDHTDESEAYLFMDIFPKPAVQIAQMQLMADNTVVISASAGINPPVVAIQSPSGGEVIEDDLVIEWTASDPDEQDRLRFTVQYSHDNGATWRTMAVNKGSTPELGNTLTISAVGVLHGSATNSALVRVLASDGINTQMATSAAFTVKNSPPFVAISTPSEGMTLPGGEPVILQGSATDPEDGGLSGSGLTWTVDGAAAGNGATIAVEGLASTTHSATLAATDANSQTMVATVNFQLAPLSVPYVAAMPNGPTLDGSCNDAAYTTSINLPLSPYEDSTQANVRLLRSDDYLWACFYNLLTGMSEQGSYVGVRVDIDNSRDATAQAGDFGFFIGENGDVFTRMGNGAGDFVAPGPGGLQGQIITDTVGWSAELRIDAATLGGWGHLINLAVGQHDLAATASFNRELISAGDDDDDYVWPFAAQWAAPATWSEAALGTQPILAFLEPSSTTVVEASAAAPLAGPLTLTVTGSSLVTGTHVVWEGMILPTTFITSEVLTAQVAETLLTTAGVFAVTVQSPDGLASNALAFTVEGAPPTITTFAPVSATAGITTPLTLTINGSNFAPDVQAFWNGTPLPTTFVNAGQIRVTVAPSLLEAGGVAGITVENPTPSVQQSAVTPYVVASVAVPDEPEPSAEVELFFPTLHR